MPQDSFPVTVKHHFQTLAELKDLQRSKNGLPEHAPYSDILHGLRNTGIGGALCQSCSQLSKQGMNQGYCQRQLHYVD